MFTSLSLCANTVDELNYQIRKDIMPNIEEGIAESIKKEIPFENYKQALENIKKPSYENLKPLFKNLTVFNAKFEKTTVSGKNKLANYLNQSVNVGWNNYRKVNMMEIFRYYFPKENPDKDIAILEYNVKSNLLTPSQYAEILMFQNTKNEEMTQLYDAYQNFAKILQNTGNYDPKALIPSFVNLIKNCNKLDQTVPGGTSLAKKSIFIQPILAGWGRTTSLEEMSRELGMKVDPLGDGINLYSPSKLKEKYGLSNEDAELMAKFIREYHIQD